MMGKPGQRLTTSTGKVWRAMPNKLVFCKGNYELLILHIAKSIP